MASVKRTASGDNKTETVGVQGSTEAEASSHQPRKRCRKAKVVQGSSDQPKGGGLKAEVVEGSSDQPKEGGWNAKLPSAYGGKDPKKQERDRKRYRNMKDAADKYKKMGPQTEDLKNETARLGVELLKISSESLPAIIQEMKTMKEGLEIVKNDNKQVENLCQFLQSKLKENDWEIPLDHEYLDGKENKSYEGIPNVENLMTDLEYPLDMFDLVGMSRQEIQPVLQKIMDRLDELERKNKELKSEIEELKRENKRLRNK